MFTIQHGNGLYNRSSRQYNLYNSFKGGSDKYMIDHEEGAEAIEDMGALLDSVEQTKPVRRGEVIEGVVLRADSDGILVDVGAKAEGTVPPGEMRTVDLNEIVVGETSVTMLVVRPEGADRPAILSIDKAVNESGWVAFSNAERDDEILDGTLIGFNRGGAIVEIFGIRGFVPISHLVTVPRDLFQQTVEAESESGFGESSASSSASGNEKADPRDEFIGNIIRLKVLEVNRPRNRAIFSERNTVQSERDDLKSKLIEELVMGEIRKGKISGISNFGAFVDLGGADGLVHISEMSWSPVSSPGDLVDVGQEIDVKVIKVDKEGQKIGLSIRQLQPEPWMAISEHIQIGDVVAAVITNVTDFGAFARLDNPDCSVEGLIHISELSTQMIRHPKDVVSEGDSVQVKVLRIEAERRRLGMSLKQASVDFAEEEY
jgi:small subunit ribosomal protein S1